MFFTKLLRIFLGDSRSRNLKKVKPLIDQVNHWCDEYDTLSDEEMQGMTARFRQRLEEGATLEDLLPEAFGAVKQVCRRLCGQSWEAGGIEQEWNMVPYDVQVCGAIYLHRGCIAEMATGEGKTLVASMPLYLNALEGKGAHLVTVNDYLARRDSEWMGRIYRELGMSVGVILTDMTPEQRRAAYNCDITYGTNNEFGFDYLRDNMTMHPDHLVQRGYHYAIVDEVDSVLIDEARTPLIISGQVDRSTHQYDTIKSMVYSLVQRQNAMVNDLVAQAEELLREDEGTKDKEKQYEAGIKLLQARKGAPKHKRLIKITGEAEIQRLIDRVEADFMRDKRIIELESYLFFVIDEKAHSIDLTEKGRTTISPDNPDLFLLTDVVEDVAAVEARDDLSDEQREELKEKAMAEHEQRSELLHNISQLLRAYILFEKDRDYVIQDNKVIIVDEFTGRMMHGRRWSDGLHQAVECKEGVTIEKETQTLATITLQNYFRMYSKLAGMTGTAETEATEFAHTYKMDVAVMPTNKPICRKDFNDLIYRTQREKFAAIIEEIRRLHEYGLPVLVGTTTVDVSEKLSKMLQRARISHNVLNAKQHEREAHIVSEAGKRGAVTIATNMAGRGTDIKLGPGVLVPFDDDPHKDNPDVPPRGLQIIGTERHESRRIDNQLRGRAGRQGDPGTSRFFISLEDDLMRLFASDRMSKLMGRGFEEGQAMEHRLANHAIASAQKKIENINFEQRKNTLEYDNVMNHQREQIYGTRRSALLAQGNGADIVLELTGEALANEWGTFCSSGDESRWDLEGFRLWVRRHVPMVDLEDLPAPTAKTEEEYLNLVLERCADVYEKKTEVLGEEIMNVLVRIVLLQIIDTHWRDHLLAIDELRQSIGLRSYGQKDPKVEYQREATMLFNDMMAETQKEIFEKIYRVTLVQQPTPQAAPARLNYQKEEGRQSVLDTARSAARQQAAQQGQEGGGQPGPDGPPRSAVATFRRTQPKVGPNDACPCGSGKKYKKCCGAPGHHAPATFTADSNETDPRA